jgi:hypothetical protein
MLNLKILIGSTRPGRAADRVIPWITGAAREHDDFTVEVLDLRDWPLPMFGETFAIEHLALVAIEAEMVPLRNSVVIPFVGNAFGPDGQPSDPRTSAAAKILLDDLVWWAKTLQEARAAGTLPPAAFRLMAAKEAAPE